MLLLFIVSIFLQEIDEQTNSFLHNVRVEKHLEEDFTNLHEMMKPCEEKEQQLLSIQHKLKSFIEDRGDDCWVGSVEMETQKLKYTLSFLEKYHHILY